MIEPTHEEMLEEAERRESALKVAKQGIEEYKPALEELARKSFEEYTKDELIDLALEEIDWIVIGGQDGEEFYGSIQFLRRVLKSLRTPEKLAQSITQHPRDAL